MRTLVALVTVLGGIGIAAPAGAEDIQAQTARLGWLDKITARIGEVRVDVGTATRLGVLSITVRSCVRRVPPDDPESAAYLDITELAEGEPARDVFHGWMFASSPALSAMDHSVYDVWVLRCEIPSDAETGGTEVPDDGSATPAPSDSGPAPLD
ncbi:DUF2155 domain-containing protein [Pararhodospirillum oryzae]|uniref:Cellulase n=1 Tax=Pararhodospirillum oryzae TaxID=478448 RepID=A0A512H702_9PROT|nr:DUF2155 domain-containing protein [Pararhodospirillum oryzae]GEO81227.1 cellulase [Pararhodospirillum oryzae]